jgi:drug/metabolite transporter (DMT)-like permease
MGQALLFWNNRKKLALVSLVVCCMVWGTTFVVIKDVSTKLSPFLLSVCRNFIAAVCIFAYLIISNKKSLLQNKIAIKYGAIIGGLLGSIYVVQTFGLQYTSTSHSAFITATAVVIVPIMLYFMGWQKITLQQLFSVFVVLLGVYLLTNGNANEPFNIGDIITFIGAFICAVHLIFSGHFVRKSELVVLVFYQFLFASLISAVGLFIVYLIEGKPIHYQAESFNSILYLGFVGTLFCFFVTVWAQKYINTVFTMMIFSLEPIFASIASYFYTGATLNSIELFGGSVILSGILIYSLPIRKWFLAMKK